MYVYKHTDWDGLKHYMTELKNNFMLSHEDKYVNQQWFEFKTALDIGINKFVPQKTLSSKFRFRG